MDVYQSPSSLLTKEPKEFLLDREFVFGGMCSVNIAYVFSPASLILLLEYQIPVCLCLQKDASQRKDA